VATGISGVRRSATVVVGGGPAGLATAACLRRVDREAVVLESTARLGDHWRGHYDRLHLHTARTHSHLPGMRFPRAYGPWVARDDMAAYLDDYARHHRLDVRTGVTATSLRPGLEGGWHVATSHGELQARSVVIATGHNRRARLPAWPGADGFAGVVVHASVYREPAPFRGRRVLVIGGGNSGAEIAVDLVEGGAERVLLALRSPPQLLPRQWLGVPVQVLGIGVGLLPTRLGDPLVRALQRLTVPDLAPQGLGRPRHGVASHLAAGGTVPVLDVGLVAAVRAGAVTPVAAVESFGRHSVRLIDGAEHDIDAVIAATGYETGLGDLVGDLGVLGADGLPSAGAGNGSAPRGLHFVGFHPTIGGHLREIGREAARTAKLIAAGPDVVPDTRTR